MPESKAKTVNDMVVNGVCVGIQLVCLAFLWRSHRRSVADAKEADKRFEQYFDQIRSTFKVHEEALLQQSAALAQQEQEPKNAEVEAPAPMPKKRGRPKKTVNEKKP